jgi:hypothetical protein
MDGHYRFQFNGVKLDPYRILEVYGISHPAQQHAIKKLLRAGNSIKDLDRDIDEVILTLNRWKEMRSEEREIEATNRRHQPPPDGERPFEPVGYSGVPAQGADQI